MFDGFSLVPLDEAGVDLLIRWRADSEVYEWYGGRPGDPATIRSEIAAESGLVNPCLVEFEGRSIGYLQFYPYVVADWRSAVGLAEDERDVWGIDLFLAAEADRNRGLGTRLLRGTLEFLAAEHGARTVLIDPHLANPRAIRCYKKAGFRALRVLLDHEQHGDEMRDALLMEWKNPATADE